MAGLPSGSRDRRGVGAREIKFAKFASFSSSAMSSSLFAFIGRELSVFILICHFGNAASGFSSFRLRPVGSGLENQTAAVFEDLLGDCPGDRFRCDDLDETFFTFNCISTFSIVLLFRVCVEGDHIVGVGLRHVAIDAELT